MRVTEVYTKLIEQHNKKLQKLSGLLIGIELIQTNVTHLKDWGIVDLTVNGQAVPGFS